MGRTILVDTTEYPSLRAAAKVHGWDGQTQRRIARCLRDGNYLPAGVGKRIRWKVAGRKQRSRKTDRAVNSELRKAVLAERGRKCEKCGGRGRLEVDHVLPRAQGGTDDRANLMVLCVGCHAEKSAAENSARKASAAKPVTIRGVTYGSIHKAAKALGVDRAQIRGHMQRGTLDRVGLNRMSRAGVTLMVPVNVGGVLHASRVHAARALRVDAKQISRRLLHAHDCWCLNTYWETWKWTCMEQGELLYADSPRKGAKCSRCGGATATRLVHTETWTDLSLNPFQLPTDPVCGKCEHAVRRSRRREVLRANRTTAERLLGMEPTVVAEPDPETLERCLNMTANTKRRPVRVNGRVFPSAASAAKAYGRNGSSVAVQLKAGRRTWLGMEVDWAGDTIHHVCPPVTVRGVEYPNAQACADALGVMRNTVLTARAKGTLDTLGTGSAKPCPVTIRGVDYPSHVAAAKALGCHTATVAKHKRMGTLDLAGTIRTGNSIPVTVDGVDYPSRKKAAEALGCSPIKIRDYVNRGGKWAQGRCIPVTVLGVTYPSMRAASAAIGCAQNYVSVLVNRGRMADLDRLARDMRRKRGGAAGRAVPRPRSRRSVKG